MHFRIIIQIASTLNIDRDNLGASTWFSLPLYERGMRLWRRASG
jgi:hypothetical protein